MPKSPASMEEVLVRCGPWCSGGFRLAWLQYWAWYLTFIWRIEDSKVRSLGAGLDMYSLARLCSELGSTVVSSQFSKIRVEIMSGCSCPPRCSALTSEPCAYRFGETQVNRAIVSKGEIDLDAKADCSQTSALCFSFEEPDLSHGV